MIQSAVRAGWGKSADTAWEYDSSKLICSLGNNDGSSNQSSKSNPPTAQLGALVDKSSDFRCFIF